jgi:hypothetical protein
MALGIPVLDGGGILAMAAPVGLPLLIISADGTPLLGGGRLPAAANLLPLVVGSDGPPTAPRGGALADGSLPSKCVLAGGDAGRPPAARPRRRWATTARGGPLTSGSLLSR